MQLTTKEVTFLADVFKDHNVLSPFRNIETQLDGSEQQSLVDKGIISNGAYTPDALKVFETIAKPDRYSSILLLSGYATIKKYTYKKGDIIILAENLNDDLRFSEPENWDEALYSFSEFLGTSSLLNIRVKVKLAIDELLLLAAIVDIYRKNTLAGYIEKASPIKSISVEEIKKELKANYKNGLLRLIAANFELKKPDPEQVEQIIVALIEKKCLEKAEGYKLTDSYTIFARNYLIPHTQVLLESFRFINGQELAAARYLAIAAGVHDIIGFWFNGKEFEMETVNAFFLLNMIETYLNCPDMEDSPGALAPKTQEHDAEEKAEAISPPPVKPVKHTVPPVQRPQNWFMQKGGQQYGPYSWQQLRSFIAEKRLMPDDLVWSESLHQWTRAGSVPDLFN